MIDTIPMMEIPKIDRKTNTIYGIVLAQTGDINNKNARFDLLSLETIISYGNMKDGLESNFLYPMAADNSKKYLGKIFDLRLGKAKLKRPNKIVDAVRGDLYLDFAASNEVLKSGILLGEYFMDLVETDPNAISSSLTIEVEEFMECNSDGEKLHRNWLWIPTIIYSCDLVLANLYEKEHQNALQVPFVRLAA